MGKISLFLSCFSIYVVSFNEAVNYRGYKVLSVTPESTENAEFLDKLAQDNSINLWKEPNDLGIPILLHVRPERAEALQETLEELEMPHSVIHPDLQSLIDHERVANSPSKEGSTEVFNFATYNNYDKILSLIIELTTKHRKLVESETIGKSVENRAIHSLKISSGDALNKPAIIIECGIQAREWAAIAACAYLVNQLVKNYGSDSTVTNLLDKYEFNVVLVANPDGYVYTWTKDRMWMKNRRPSSKNKFSGECYILTAISISITADRVAKIGMEALSKPYNTKYSFGTRWDMERFGNGGSSDYAYVKQNITYAYTIELRDEGQYGHVLPKEQILPTCIETYAGLLAAINAMK